MIFILSFIHKDFKTPLEGIFFRGKQYALQLLEDSYTKKYSSHS